MKTKPTIISGFYVCAIASLLVCACKGKEGAPGPAGVNGTITTRDTVFINSKADQKEGYIRGIFTDTTINQEIRSAKVDFSYSLPTRNSFDYFNSSGSSINVMVVKNDSLGTSNLTFAGNYLTISFNFPDSLVTKGGLITGPITSSVWTSLLLKTSDNTYLIHSCQACGSTSEVRDVLYNPQTRIITGKVFAKFPPFSTSTKGASFQGTFSSKMIKIIF